MKKMLLVSMLLVSTHAFADFCPEADVVMNSVKTEGNMTITQDLSDSCKKSVQIAKSCGQQDNVEYSLRLATAAKVQCEYELMRKRDNNVSAAAGKTSKFRTSFSRYLDLRYSCEQKQKSGVAQELCKAESARLVLTYL